MAVLNADAEETTLEHLPMAHIENFDIDFDTSVEGVPSYWLRYGDYIYLKPCPNYNETNGLRAYVDRVGIRLTYTTCTISNATPAVVTATAHGLAGTSGSDCDAVFFVTDGALPTGLSTNTIYYVTKVDADTFRLSTTPSDVGSTYVNTSSAGSGTHQFVKISGSPGIPSIHHLFLARYASLPFLIEKGKDNKNDIATLISQDEKKIEQFFANRDKDIAKQITFESTPWR